MKIKKCPPFTHDYDPRAHGIRGRLGFFKVCRRCGNVRII